MRTGTLNLKQDDGYYTPYWFVRSIIGSSPDYDPATTIKKAYEFGVSEFDTKETNGLKRDWGKYKKIWINPPFTQKKAFLEKAVDTWLNCRNDIYFLCPVLFITTITFSQCVKKVGSFTLYLPEGRLNFEKDGARHSPAFGTVVIKIGGENKIIHIPSKEKNEQKRQD